jgi:hypothetical protein
MGNNNRETCRRYRTKVQPDKGHKKPWSPFEDQQVLTCMDPLPVIAQRLERTVGAVTTRRYQIRKGIVWCERADPVAS